MFVGLFFLIRIPVSLVVSSLPYGYLVFVLVWWDRGRMVPEIDSPVLQSPVVGPRSDQEAEERAPLQLFHTGITDKT